ncbi:macrophage colony-stimulating factor 1 isoform X6 [Suricata suricatta]|uniref:macrophage colony-stimulating factor 1 isoform X6 n=1 Tax=Suricata suricatta TaxID=37032 RepID=UPI00115542E2|nr:macrophage colony-stimulating factor 1 isoform X6 [Suricata suricatta]
MMHSLPQTWLNRLLLLVCLLVSKGVTEEASERCSHMIGSGHLQLLQQLIDSQMETSCQIAFEFVDQEQLKDPVCYLKKAFLLMQDIMEDTMRFKDNTPNANFIVKLQELSLNLRSCFTKDYEEQDKACVRTFYETPLQLLEKIKNVFNETKNLLKKDWNVFSKNCNNSFAKCSSQARSRQPEDMTGKPLPEMGPARPTGQAQSHTPEKTEGPSAPTTDHQEPGSARTPSRPPRSLSSPSALSAQLSPPGRHSWGPVLPLRELEGRRSTRDRRSPTELEGQASEGRRPSAHFNSIPLTDTGHERRQEGPSDPQLPGFVFHLLVPSIILVLLAVGGLLFYRRRWRSHREPQTVDSPLERPEGSWTHRTVSPRDETSWGRPPPPVHSHSSRNVACPPHELLTRAARLGSLCPRPSDSGLTRREGWRMPSKLLIFIVGPGGSRPLEEGWEARLRTPCASGAVSSSSFPPSHAWARDPDACRTWESRVGTEEGKSPCAQRTAWCLGMPAPTSRNLSLAREA